MPRTLIAPHGTLNYSNLQWGLLIKLAYDHQWTPYGVRPPEDWCATNPASEGGGTKRWHFMDYFSLKRQRIIAIDALAIADALERALPDIPTHDALSHKVIQEIQLPDFEEPMRMLQPGVSVNAFEFFSGKGRRALEEFIALARWGSMMGKPWAFELTGSG